MKKNSKTFCAFGLISAVLAGNMAFGATNPQITRLMNEKNQKMAKLEQCAKKVNGFKIAGISTLGLTAAGVAGNVVLSGKKKGLETELASTQKSLESEEKKLASVNEQIVKKEQEIKQKNCESTGGKWNGTSCEQPSVSTTSSNNATVTVNNATGTAQTNQNNEEVVANGSGNTEKDKIYEAIYSLYEKYDAECGVTYPFLSDAGDAKTTDAISKLSAKCKLTDKDVNTCMKTEGLTETKEIFKGVGVVCKVCECQG